MKRRDFLLQSTVGAISAVPLLRADAQPTLSAERFIGLQIHPFSFYDEGPERVLDLLQETANVNALLVYTHLYAADQSVPKEVLAHDHPGFTPVEPKQRQYRKVWTRHDAKSFQGYCCNMIFRSQVLNTQGGIFSLNSNRFAKNVA